MYPSTRSPRHWWCRTRHPLSRTVRIWAVRVSPGSCGGTYLNVPSRPSQLGGHMRHESVPAILGCCLNPGFAAGDTVLLSYLGVQSAIVREEPETRSGICRRCGGNVAGLPRLCLNTETRQKRAWKTPDCRQPLPLQTAYASNTISGQRLLQLSSAWGKRVRLCF